MAHNSIKITKIRKNNESEMRNYSNFDTNIGMDSIYSHLYHLPTYREKKKKKKGSFPAPWTKAMSYTRHFLPLFSDYFNWVVC